MDFLESGMNEKEWHELQRQIFGLMDKSPALKTYIEKKGYGLLDSPTFCMCFAEIVKAANITHSFYPTMCNDLTMKVGYSHDENVEEFGVHIHSFDVCTNRQDVTVRFLLDTDLHIEEGEDRNIPISVEGIEISDTDNIVHERCCIVPQNVKGRFNGDAFLCLNVKAWTFLELEKVLMKKLQEVLFEKSIASAIEEYKKKLEKRRNEPLFK